MSKKNYSELNITEQSISKQKSNLKHILQVDDNEAKNILKNIEENIERESKKKDKEWSEENKNKIKNVIAHTICEEYQLLENEDQLSDKKSNTNKTLVLLKWGGYGKEELINRIINLVEKEVNTNVAEDTENKIDKLSYKQLENIYRDLLDLFDVVNFNRIRGILSE